MRLALETESPLPQYKCWYGFNANEGATVADLRKAINKDLELTKSSRDLTLKAGDWAFLPHLPVENLIRDEDIITVSLGKRKKETAVKAEKPKKREKSNTVLANDKSSKNKKRKSQASEGTGKPAKKKRENKKDAVLKAPAPAPLAPPPATSTNLAPTSSPHSGLTKTQKRNRRKAVLRIKQREEETQQQQQQQQQQEKQQQQQQAEQAVPETSYDDIAAPEHLVKFNKNKRKDFMKVMNKKKREHVRFDKGNTAADGELADTTVTDESMSYPENAFDAYGEEQHTVSGWDGENLYGSAYVTSMEADRRYKGEQMNSKTYPIDQVDDHFYAEAPPPSDETRADDSHDVDTAVQEHEAAQQQQPIQRNYDELTVLSFSGPLMPAVSDRIAIKILSMTESYTPEISDWKEVKVLSLNLDGQDPSMTVEYQPGFLLKKHRGKFDLPDEDEDEDEDEEEENEFAKDQTMTYFASDIIEMRRVEP